MTTETRHQEISDSGTWSMRRLGPKVAASAIATLVAILIASVVGSWIATRDRSARLDTAVQRHEQQIQAIDENLDELERRTITIDANTQHMRKRMDQVLRRIERQK